MIGFDLQEVARIKNPEKLLEKIALEGEILYIKGYKCNFSMRVAALWSLKEAVFKALGVSEGEISYKEIELCHKQNGQPYVVLHGKAKAHFEASGFKTIEVSISHQPNAVGAVCIVWGGTKLFDGDTENKFS